MRRFKVLSLAVLLLVTACTKPVAPVPPEATTLESQTMPAPSEVPSTGIGEAVVPVPSAPDLLVASPMPEGVRRVELAAGQSISAPGLYYMDVATGNIEGWLMPPFDQKRAMRWMQTTPDHRWIIFELDGQGYLIRRSDAKAFSYDPERIGVTPGHDVFLLQPAVWRAGGESGRFTLVDGDMQLISALAADPGVPGNVQLLFSPDGKKLAVAEGSGRGGLSLVEVATGTVVKVAGAWDDSIIRFVTLPALGEFAVIHHDYLEPLWVERYNWQGEFVGRKQVEGWDVAISNNGRMLAVTQSMGLYGEAVILHDWEKDKPLLRVAGGIRPAWQASGSELVVDTSRGWQLVSRNGDIRIAPEAGAPRWHPFEWYQPSPDRPDLFLTGMKVVDRSGRVVQATQIPEGAQARALSAGWGPASREVHMVVIPPLGKGSEIGPWGYFLPRVQQPPFPERHPLQVQGSPGGECLDLRAAPSLQGRIVRCMPAGTHLAMRLTPEGNTSTTYEDQMLWLAVETDVGDAGWIAVSTGSITYAD